MTTATITGPLLADDLTLVAHRTVHVSLVAGPGGGHSAGGELIGPVVTTTDASGQFSMALTINPEITPAGSHYLVQVPGLASWTILLPSAGTFHVGDPAIQTTTQVIQSGATTAYVDAQDEVLDARLDIYDGLNVAARIAALEAAGSGTPAALPGFMDLSGQTRQMFRVTSVGSSQNPIVALRAGHLVGISITGTAARTAGSAVFTVTINGADTALVATIDASNPQFWHVAGSVAFAAGDRLSVRHADSGFTPSTNFEVTLWVTYP